MIPLQITLDGFMSYRDAQTLRFEGATLWLLCGRNGAGKSTVFDAIKYALFGTHRGGTQGAEALIHHERASLKVAFDFQSGDQTYRVIRTRGRKGRPTVQALHLSAETEGLAALSGVQPIAETDMEEGYRRWLGTTLGLTEATFVASTLLQQGKSDALLEAPPAKRHEMLLEIVDLAPYEALARSADERRKAAHIQAEILERRLSELPAITPEMVDEAIIIRDERQALLHGLGPRRDTLLQLVPRAERWAALQSQLRAGEDELAAFRAQEAHAPDLERDAARLVELDGVVPFLERAQELGVRAAQTAREELAARTRVAASREARLQIEAKRDAALQALRDTEDQSRELQARREEARTAQLETAPVLQRLEHWQRERAVLQRAATALSTLGLTLEADLQDAQKSLCAAQEATGVLPSLRRLVSLEEETRNTRDARAVHQEAVARDAQALAESQRVRLQTADALQQTLQTLNETREKVAQARAASTSAQEALCRFEQVEGEARCGYCGQDLSPEHRAWEHARLNEAWDNETKSLRHAEDEFASAVVRQDEVETRLKQETNTERAREARLRTGEHALQSAEDNLQRLTQEATTLRAELPAPWSRVSAPPPAEDREDTSASSGGAPFLTALRKAAGQAEGRTYWQNRVGELQAQRGQQVALLREREEAETRLRELTQELGENATEERIVILRQAARDAAFTVDEATRTLHHCELARQRAQTDHDVATRAFDEARASVAQAQRDQAVAQAQRGEIERASQEVRAQTPAAWLVRVEDAFAERETAEQWKMERARLQRSDAAGAWQRWQTTRARAAERSLAYEAAQREAEAIPEVARRGTAAINADLAQLSAESQRYETEARHAERDLRAREAERDAHLAAETEAAQANRERDLYRTLAEALGRDGLQRRLLQEAEDAIVEHANAVLDRLSSGTLRLEVRRETSTTTASNNAGSLSPNVEIKQKALDLVAFDSSSGEGTNSIPTAFLSGSQKFRVSVALAIGIGNYASRGARRVESVIIDEGFGALDAEGRGAMIEELHALGELLQRVIVVSHQEDFAAAFPNRYRIMQEGGASKALLQSGSE